MTEGSIALPYVPFPAFEAFAQAPFDPATLDRFVSVLDTVKKQTSPEQMQRAVERATKWAAVDTGAIEGLYDVERGFTLSVAAEAAAWNNIHLVKGEAAARSMNDALQAYEYVLDLATRHEGRDITETWIKELHAVICSSQDTYTVITAAGPQEHKLPKGQYKKYPNNPLNLAANAVHGYAPVDDTPSEMHRLVEELRGTNFQNAHPVVQAGYAHYAFVCIHPFADGNGRVARALASAYLYRSPGVPLVIFADQKPGYIDALENADAGDYGPFMQFISDRAIDVIGMVTADMRRTPRPPVEVRLREMHEALRGRGGLLHDEVNALGARLLDEFLTALQRAIVTHAVAEPLALRVDRAPGEAVAAKNAYRSVPNTYPIKLSATVSGTGSASRGKMFMTMIMKGSQEGADFIIASASGDIIEEALIRDLTPVTNPALTYRLDVAAEEQVLKIVDEVVEASRAALRKAGYRE